MKAFNNVNNATMIKIHNKKIEQTNKQVNFNSDIKIIKNISHMCKFASHHQYKSTI